MQLPVSRTIRWMMVSVLLSTMFSSPAVSQTTVAPDPVAVTDRFVFYSRFRMNLHDELVEAAASDTVARNCAQGVTEQERAAWDGAVQRYRDLFAGREGRRRALVVRFHLAGFGEAVRDELGSMPEAAAEALDAGAAAYRACWWVEDDAANRRWIAAIVPVLEEVGDEIASRLSQAYQTPWKASAIPVDVAQYVNFGGANTVLDPDHILITSVRDGFQGRAGLEMIFHEASHTIIGPRAGEPSRHLRLLGERLGVEVPGVLSHVVLFYTTGQVVRRVIEERFSEEYVPYMYAGGLFDRAWPAFQAPMETWWQRYLDGHIPMAEAADGLLRAVSR